MSRHIGALYRPQCHDTEEGGVARGTPRQAFRIAADKWQAFGDAAQRLDPPADRAELLRQFIDWFTRQKGAKLPARPAAAED